MSVSKAIRTHAVSIIFLSLWCGLALAFTSGPLQAAPQLNDRSISDAVEDDLRVDPFVSAHWIDITTSDGIVTLSGRVDNIQSKQRATRITETIKGVRAVVNTIEVQPFEPRSDAAIRDDVKLALLTDPATDTYEIDVNVENNTVTLSGTVNSWQARELCGKVASGVKGVKELNNSIVFTYDGNRPDKEIRQDIIQALRWDVLVDHALIDVAVADGHVVLSGIVGSLAEKRRAIRVAYVVNVTEVDTGNLMVRRWARDPDLKADKYQNIADADIEDALQDALTQDPRVASHPVTVEVRDGRVTLRGTVDNLKAKRAAGQCAQNTVGVQEVKNRLKVRPQGIYRDEQLEDRIRQAFRWDPFVNSDEIVVDVQQGIVGLVGTVDTYLEKIQAENLASRVNGVVAVNNHLVVTGDPGLHRYDPFIDDLYAGGFGLFYDPPVTFQSDAEIKSAIEDEIYWSPFVDSGDVDVNVYKGQATLTGTVDSLREYRAAAQNAFDGGAVVVHNELKVR